MTPWILFWYTNALELEDVEFVEKVLAGEAESDHAFPEVEFLGCSVAGGVDDDFGLVACEVEDCELCGGWGRGAFDTPYSNAGITVSIP